MRLATLLITIFTSASFASSPWTIPDAPFRAVLQLDKPGAAETGVAITLPEFGQTLPDGSDAVLTDAQGHILPLALAWHSEGHWAILLTQSLKRDQDYVLYFGGNKHRSGKTWTPAVSLLMETRRLPTNFKTEAMESANGLRLAWESATDRDGAGWVESIFQGGNPFGPSRDVLAHYTGYLRTKENEELTLYTQSSDASFVFVNGQFAFGWGGRHSGAGNAKTVIRKKVRCDSPLTRIDYYHAKIGNEPCAVLGWEREGKLAPIPDKAWLHPGTTCVKRIEDHYGHEVPIPIVQLITYMGYGGRWLYETECKVSPDWMARWQFEDGAVVSKTEFRRPLVGDTAQKVVVQLKRGNEEMTAVRRITFPETVNAASINNKQDVRRYLDMLTAENPDLISNQDLVAFFLFAQAFGSDEEAARFAVGYLNRTTDTTDPLWIEAKLVRLRVLAQRNPQQALIELRKILPETRKRYAVQFDTFELDLLAFDLRDGTILQRAPTLTMLSKNPTFSQLAAVRIGDYYRLEGKLKDAFDQYQGVQKKIVEESEGRKLPSQDRAFSLMVTEMIERNQRTEAEQTLLNWELKHPLAKFQGDFLLLRSRVLMSFGRWQVGLMEIESFERLQPDSPYQVDIAFYRARAMFELGKKSEARAIWKTIAEKYPRHELAVEAKNWEAKP